MKRMVVSAVVVAAFVFYAIFSRGQPDGQTAGTEAGAASASLSGSAAAQSASTHTTTLQSQTTTSAASGRYSDGTYTGFEVDALYGIVQVEVVIEGGQITDIQFLSRPSGREESEEINRRATPILTQEAVAAQSANVQVVSGATLTSQAFMQSLQSALDQA